MIHAYIFQMYFNNYYCSSCNWWFPVSIINMIFKFNSILWLSNKSFFIIVSSYLCEIFGIWLFWKIFLSHLFKKRIWKTLNKCKSTNLLLCQKNIFFKLLEKCIKKVIYLIIYVQTYVQKVKYFLLLKYDYTVHSRRCFFLLLLRDI